VYIYTTHTHTRVHENRVKVSAAETVEGKHGPYYGEVMRSEAERRVGGGEGGTRRRTLADGRVWKRGVSVVKVDGLLFSFSSARWRSFAVSLSVSGKHAYFPSTSTIPQHRKPSRRSSADYCTFPYIHHRIYALRVEICCMCITNTEKIQ